MCAPTASFLCEVAGLLTSWLADLVVDQVASGAVPEAVPNVIDSPNQPKAALGDAAIILHWGFYQRYGDVGILAAQFDS